VVSIIIAIKMAIKGEYLKEIDSFISITEAKNRLLDIIRTIERNDDVIAITKNGLPTAVILSMERFEGILETIDILTDEKAMRSLRKSIKEGDAGRWVSNDSVFKK
jgi:antitoxin YefM